MSATTWERTETASRFTIGPVEFDVRQSGDDWYVRVHLKRVAEVLDDSYDDRSAAEAACEAWAQSFVDAAAAAGIAARRTGT